MNDPAGYCEVSELLIGQIVSRLPPQVVPGDFIETASNEMDGKLGFIYKTPLVIEGEDALPAHQGKLIKDICIKLSSGRIILAATSAMESSTIHAYGASLVKDAMTSLMAIANGEVRLSAIRVDSEGNPRPDSVNPELADPLAYVPGGSNRDTQGGTEAFERNFMRPSNYPLQPYSDPYRPGDA